MKKKITLTLMATFLCLSCLPAEAGYYKTIYIEEETPNIVIQNIQPTKTVVVEKNNYTPTYDSSVATALGLTALVGGVILGVASHKHYKKHHKASHHFKSNHAPKKKHPFPRR